MVKRVLPIGAWFSPDDRSCGVFGDGIAVFVDRLAVALHVHLREEREREREIRQSERAVKSHLFSHTCWK